MEVFKMRYSIVILFLLIFQFAFAQKVKQYWPNGNLKAKGTLVNGVRKGNWKSYYKTGELEQEGQFVYHKGSTWQDGTMTTYYKDGKVKYKHLYNYADYSEVKTEWDSLGNKLSESHAIMRDAHENKFEIEYNGYSADGSSLKEHFILYSKGLQMSYVSYYKALDTNEVLNVKALDTLLVLKAKNELLNTWLPSRFSFEALQNFYASAFDKKSPLKLMGTWRKRTGGGKPLDEIVYKEGRVYDRLSQFYNSDTLSYSRYLYEKDTFYLYPIIIIEESKSHITGFNNSSTISWGGVGLPLILPTFYPDGKWLALIPLKMSDISSIKDKKSAQSFIDLYNHTQYHWIKNNGNGLKLVVAQYGLFKNGKREGESYSFVDQTHSDLDIKLGCKTLGFEGDFQDTTFNSPTIIIKGRLHFGRVGNLRMFSNGHCLYISGYGGCATEWSHHETNDSTFNGKYWVKAGGENNFGFVGGYIQRGEYKNGKREGFERIYNRNEIVVGEKKWLHNQLLSTKFFDMNGVLTQEFFYSDATLNKTKETTYKDGKLEAEYLYKNGVFYKTIYYKNGKKWKEELAPKVEY